MNDIKYYVYLHRLSETGEIFYVGKGHGKRAWEKTDRNIYWKTKTRNSDYQVEIYKNDLAEEEAYTLEKELIAEYKTIFTGGCLVNLTEGGEGRAGYSWEGKRKGANNPMSGKVQTEETRQKIALTKIGKPRPQHVVEATRVRNLTRPKEEHGMFGKKHTEQTKEKMKIAAKSKKYKNSDVLNLETGIYYYGWQEVAESINLKIHQVEYLRKKGKLTNYIALWT